MAARELTRRRNTATATELEHIGAVGQARVEISDPFERGRVDPAGPLCVAQRDRVVTARDDLLRFPRNRAAGKFPHPPEGNGAVTRVR